MNIFRKTDFILLVLIIAIAFVCIFSQKYKQDSTGITDTADTQYYVVIEVAGEEIVRLPLNENTTYSVDQGDMHNVVVIEGGSVYMSEADCPNQNCVRQGKITEVGVPIVCLPHQVIVMIVIEE